MDLADILEELDSSQRAALLDGLDTEQASDTLEEIDPAVQRDIVFSLSKERVAQLIGEMTPGQAADIVSVLPGEEQRAILRLLESAMAAKIEEIVESHGIRNARDVLRALNKDPHRTMVVIDPRRTETADLATSTCN